VIVLGIIIAIVLLFFLGWVVVGLALKLLWWALIGLVIGALARLILPGRQAIGLLATAGAGVAAALLGGIIGNALDLGSFLGPPPDCRSQRHAARAGIAPSVDDRVHEPPCDVRVEPWRCFIAGRARG
jgi:uncharacterized membrane protein YeaQ/YmgE (transglycosylase-associated protein family)